MPEARWERIAACVILCAIFVVSALVLLDGRPNRPNGRTKGDSRNSVTVELSSSTRPAGISLPSRASFATAARTQKPRTRLVLTATDGDTWLTVHARTATGKILYFGILLQGQSVTLDGRMWIRFGSTSHLAARLNGKPLALPPGTYNALITADGLRRLPEQ